MMADMRLVLLRHVDAMTPTEQTNLADYLDDPSESTCFVLTATKLDGRAKLAKAAKKKGYLIDAKPLRGRELREFIRGGGDGPRTPHRPASDRSPARCRGRRPRRDRRRDGAVVTVRRRRAAHRRRRRDECVTRIRVESIWSLVDAIGLKDRRKGIAAAQSLLDDREPPLRLLAMVARQLRIVARMREALSEGLRPQDAAKRAGAPPFKAGDLTESARQFTAESLGERSP